LSKKLALIVDDDETLQVLTKRQLAALGFDSHFVRNGREAVEAAKEHAYDVIFMDVQMPEMDGLEATSHIREAELREGKTRVPIIALTASREKDTAMSAGMDDFLFKPVLLEALQKVLQKWVGEP
jgi:CheY-like chemotaxis protein